MRQITVTKQNLAIFSNYFKILAHTEGAIHKLRNAYLGTLIQGRWYLHILSLLTGTCSLYRSLGMCTNQVKKTKKKLMDHHQRQTV